MSRAAHTDWTFGGLWPYRPRWFDSPDGRLHYVDEGDRGAPVVVLLHGNPTWGFLYRNFIPPLLEAGCRVVVPDYLGFGRSAKPADRAAYTIRGHADRLAALLDSLDLTRVTLVPQDWGGPVGMWWAVANPDRVAGLFILNTAAHVPVGTWKIPPLLRLFRMRGTGELLVKGLKLFHHGFLFGAGTVERARLTRQVRQAYLAPHPTWSSRTGVLEFPRAIPTSPADEPMASFGRELEAGMEGRLRDKPVRIVWGMRDVGFKPEVIDQMWLRTFPHADVLRLPDAGHFLQEDAHELIVPALVDFQHSLPAPR